MKPLWIFCICYCFWSLNTYGQTIVNGDLEGDAPVLFNTLPDNWMTVPYTDLTSTADIYGDRPDLSSELAPGPVSQGYRGIPYSGFTFISGVHDTQFESWDFPIDTSWVWTQQEGIQQEITDLSVGCSYEVSFYQTVVKNNTHQDTTGSWKVFLDNSYIGTSLKSASYLAYDDPNLVWEQRIMTFTASSPTHDLKFLAWDGDELYLPYFLNEGVRMGLDLIEIHPIEGNINLGNDTTLCEGDTLVLYPSPNFSGASFEWQDGSTDSTFIATEPGLYIVNVVNGCYDFTDSIYLSPCDFKIYLEGDTICFGNSTTLTALDSNEFGEVTYDWGELTPITTAGPITVNPNESQEYMVIGTDELGRVDTAYASIYVQKMSPFAHSNVTNGCEELEVSFTDASVINFGSITNWLWNFGDGHTNIEENPVHSYENEGVYDLQLKIISDLGCEADTLITSAIHVYPQAKAAFSFAMDHSNCEVQFFNQSTKSTEWLWKFSTGESYNSYQLAKEYPLFQDQYDVTLIAFNDYGCFDTTQQTILVPGKFLIYAPNAFTPNGDNLNDNWRVYVQGISISDYHCIIFNRWGETIWESYDPNGQWNGSVGGKTSPDGIYNWKVTVKEDATDKRHVFNGHVVIID